MENQKLYYTQKYNLLITDLVHDHFNTYDDLTKSDKEALTTYLLMMERNPVAFFFERLGGSDLLANVLEYMKNSAVAPFKYQETAEKRRARLSNDFENLQSELISDSEDQIAGYYKQVINQDLSDELSLYLSNVKDVNSDSQYLHAMDNKERFQAIRDWA